MITKIKTKKFLIVILCLALLGAGAGAYYFKNKDNKQATSPSSDGVNYNPPTEQEKKEAEENKKSIDEREEQANSQSDPSYPKKVTPVIVSYGQVNNDIKVSSRVPGIFESSGTCTLTLSKAALKVTQTKTAVQNVSEMSCGAITVSRNKLSAGIWTAQVSYSSSKASGESQTVKVEVK